VVDEAEGFRPQPAKSFHYEAEKRQAVGSGKGGKLRVLCMLSLPGSSKRALSELYVGRGKRIDDRDFYDCCTNTVAADVRPDVTLFLVSESRILRFDLAWDA